MQDPENPSIPPFSIRESLRARRVILKLYPDRGLEVVIPQGFDRRKIPAIVREQKDWIQQAFKRLEAKGLSNCSSDLPPKSIHLQALGKVFTVRYEAEDSQPLRLEHTEGDVLKFSGKIDQDGCRELLQAWLQHQGKIHLVPWLKETSRATKLKYGKAQVRGQKTRWASCSASRTISLNYKLLFIPPELVRYIFIHELCHTMHMNHSPRFWSLVERLEPRYKTLDAQMNAARRFVPLWA